MYASVDTFATEQHTQSFLEHSTHALWTIDFGIIHFYQCGHKFKKKMYKYSLYIIYIYYIVYSY